MLERNKKSVVSQGAKERSNRCAMVPILVQSHIIGNENGSWKGIALCEECSVQIVRPVVIIGIKHPERIVLIVVLILFDMERPVVFVLQNEGRPLHDRVGTNVAMIGKFGHGHCAIVTKGKRKVRL